MRDSVLDFFPPKVTGMLRPLRLWFLKVPWQVHELFVSFSPEVLTFKYGDTISTSSSLYPLA